MSASNWAMCPRCRQNRRKEADHAGYWQRRQGAWSWFIEDADTGKPVNIGSQCPRRELTGKTEANPNEYGEWSIDLLPATSQGQE